MWITICATIRGLTIGNSSANDVWDPPKFRGGNFLHSPGVERRKARRPTCKVPGWSSVPICRHSRRRCRQCSSSRMRCGGEAERARMAWNTSASRRTSLSAELERAVHQAALSSLDMNAPFVCVWGKTHRRVHRIQREYGTLAGRCLTDRPLVTSAYLLADPTQ